MIDFNVTSHIIHKLWKKKSSRKSRCRLFFEIIKKMHKKGRERERKKKKPTQSFVPFVKDSVTGLLMYQNKNTGILKTDINALGPTNRREVKMRSFSEKLIFIRLHTARFSQLFYMHFHFWCASLYSTLTIQVISLFFSTL